MARGRYLDTPVRAIRMDAPAIARAERCLRSDDQRARGETLAVIVDGQRAVEMFVDLDPSLGVAAPARSRQDL